MHHTKIAVIGAGNVGATIAYTLMIKNLAAELVLIDVNEKKEAGEVMDIADGLCFTETGRVMGGSLRDGRDADIIIITAGSAQGERRSRLQLLDINKKIVSSIFSGLKPLKAEAIVLMISNPVDILTKIAQARSGLPRHQVFGTGTALDTARLQWHVARAAGVSPHEVHGYVLGEHGDSQFVAWSTVTVGGQPISDISAIPKKLWEKIAVDVRRQAYNIIDRKGATYYGIAATAAAIVESIVFDQGRIFAVSSHLQSWNGISGVCLGAPAVIGRNGIRHLSAIKLPWQERRQLKKSASIVKKYLRGL